MLLNTLSRAKSRILLIVAGIVGTVVAAVAQTTPPEVDWAEQATTVRDSLTSQIVTILPIILGVFALFIGLAVFKRLMKGFAK